MTTIARRTPENEEGSSYGYRDLLKDIMRKISTGATSNVERMTSGGMSDEEVLETALAPAGGMLKIAGTGKLLAGLLKREAASRIQAGEEYFERYLRKQSQKSRNAFREALLIPEKEWSRINDIEWSKMKGQELGTQGLYSPYEQKISLLKSGPSAGTVPHEFTHARDLLPEKSEAFLAKALVGFEAELRPRLSLKGIDPQTFYQSFSPTERHARAMEKVFRRGNINYDEFYRKTLKKEVNIAEKGLRNLGEEELIRTMWESSFGFR